MVTMLPSGLWIYKFISVLDFLVSLLWNCSFGQCELLLCEQKYTSDPVTETDNG